MLQQRARKQRLVTSSVAATRTLSIVLETAEFKRLEQLAVRYNVGNGSLARQIIYKYLEQANQARDDPTAQH
jgi:hypothetical protein